MQVGDVVLLKTDGDTELRWVGVVSMVDGDYVEYIGLCTTERDGKRQFFSLSADDCRYTKDLVVLGNVDQSVYSGEGETAIA